MSKFALVTGSSSGLGLEIARQLVHSGWRVLGCSRSEAAIDDSNYKHLSLDLSKPEDQQELLSYLESMKDESFTTIALVNNAGTLGAVASIGSLAIETISETYSLNVHLPIMLMNYFLQTWQDKAELRIVNISSGAAKKFYSGWGLYCSTKAALRSASYVLAKDIEYQRSRASHPVGSVGILVYEPGVLDTPMQEVLRSSSEDSFAELARFKALHENGELVDPVLPAADVVAQLSSDSMEPFNEMRYST